MSTPLRKIPQAPLAAATSDQLYNDLVDAVEELRQQYADNFSPYCVPRSLPAIPEVFIGTVSSTPCQSSGDTFTDARYYVNFGRAKLTLDYDNTGTGSDIFDGEQDDVAGKFGLGCVIATNLAQLPCDKTGIRPRVPDNLPVLVTAVRSRANPMRKYYVFRAQPPGVVLVASLAQTGGDGGSQTTSASWTYKVTDWKGTVLAANASPQVPRPTGAMVAAVFGLAYYAQDGLFYLLYAFEIPGTDPCP